MAIIHLFSSSKADGSDATLIKPSDWNASHTIDPSTITRAQTALDARNWQFLGRATVSGSIPAGGKHEATTMGPVILPGYFPQLQMHIYALPSGNAGTTHAVGIMCGSSSIDTGNNCSTGAFDPVVAATVAITAQTSVRVQSVLTGAGVSGSLYAKVDIANLRGWTKRFVGQTSMLNTMAGGTVPLYTFFGGTYSGSHPGFTPIMQLQVRSFSSVTSDATLRGFGSGSYFVVYGRNND